MYKLTCKNGEATYHIKKDFALMAAFEFLGGDSVLYEELEKTGKCRNGYLTLEECKIQDGEIDFDNCNFYVLTLCETGDEYYYIHRQNALDEAERLLVDYHCWGANPEEEDEAVVTDLTALTKYGVTESEILALNSGLAL
jgi:hypothetical protein